jgi:hypothetical protein
MEQLRKQTNQGTAAAMLGLCSGKIRTAHKAHTCRSAGSQLVLQPLYKSKPPPTIHTPLCNFLIPFFFYCLSTITSLAGAATCSIHQLA